MTPDHRCQHQHTRVGGVATYLSKPLTNVTLPPCPRGGRAARAGLRQINLSPPPSLALTLPPPRHLRGVVKVGGAAGPVKRPPGLSADVGGSSVGLPLGGGRVNAHAQKAGPQYSFGLRRGHS